MIRPTLQEEITLLLDVTRETERFKPMEIQALREVLDDYFDSNQEEGHRSITLERQGQVLGFAYYAPAPMTDRTWQLYWIVVRRDTQARGIGTELLRYVEENVRQLQGRVLFIDTSSLPHYELTRKFYLKHGYEQHAVLADFYAAGDDLVVFRKAF
jgi:GNAT superfamily N-acetyltransferase